MILMMIVLLCYLLFCCLDKREYIKNAFFSLLYDENRYVEFHPKGDSDNKALIQCSGWSLIH